MSQVGPQVTGSPLALTPACDVVLPWPVKSMLPIIIIIICTDPDKRLQFLIWGLLKQSYKTVHVLVFAHEEFWNMLAKIIPLSYKHIWLIMSSRDDIEGQACIINLPWTSLQVNSNFDILLAEHKGIWNSASVNSKTATSCLRERVHHGSRSMPGPVLRSGIGNLFVTYKRCN